MTFKYKTFIIGVLLFFIMPITAFSSSHKDFLKYLINLEGWTGKAGDGMTMDMGNMKFMNATREYSNNGLELTAMIIRGTGSGVGMNPAGVRATPQHGAETEIMEINGFKVAVAFDNSDNSGVVSVALAEDAQGSASFALVFTGLEKPAAIALAKKFDWAAIKTKLEE